MTTAYVDTLDRVGDGPMLLVGTRKGAWMLSGDDARVAVEGVGADVPRAHRAAHRCSIRATADAAARDAHRPPRPDGVPLDRPRRARGTRRRSRPRSRPATRCERSLNAVFWLTPGHADEPGVWYAGGSPQGLFRTEDGGDTWEPVTRLERPPELWETWAEWPDENTPDGSMLHSVIVDPRDPAHLYIGLSARRRVREHRRRRRLAAAQRGLRCATFFPDPSPSSATTRTACGCIRCDPTGSTSRTTAASTAWTGPRAGGCASATTCRATSATSASRSSCTRAIPTPRGCSRWTAPTCGRARVPTGKPAAYVTRDAGESWTRLDTGLPERAWFTVKRQAMTVDDRRSGRRLLRHDERRDLGERRRRRSRGRASPSTCPRSTRVEHADPRPGVKVRIPDSAAVVHRTAAGRRRRRAPRSPSSSPTSTVRYPGHPVPHGRRAGPHPQAHEGVRQRRVGA